MFATNVDVDNRILGGDPFDSVNLKISDRIFNQVFFGSSSDDAELSTYASDCA